MSPLTERFIRFLLDSKAFKTGDFTLKDGSKSKYFINTGAFETGKLLWELAQFYGDKIKEVSKNEEIQVLFGPAYKGIPLVASTALYLYSQHQINVHHVYNRKETKAHGEASADQSGRSGVIVGKIPPNASIYILDDVFTSGATKWAEEPRIKGLVLAVNRNIEKAEEFTQKTGIPVYSLVSLPEIESYLEANPQ